MNPIAIAVLLALLAPGDDVVEAAREAKKKRRGSTTKVITNKDVRAAKGKLIETSAAPPEEAPAAEPMTFAKHEEAKRDRAEAERRLKLAKEAASATAAELALIEQQYYAEDDLDRRDGEIVRRFADARTRHEKALAEVAAAERHEALQLASPVVVIGATPGPETESVPVTPPSPGTPPPSNR